MSNKKITKINKNSTTKASKSLNIKELKKETAHPQQILIDQLISWGLNQNEALVYVYLLERGTEVGGSKIAMGTKLHRQYVYKALDVLIKMGLSESVLHGKLSKYKALSPNNLEKIAKKKALEAGDLSHRLNKISKVNFEQDFEVLVGKKAIQEYEYDYVLSAKEKQDQYIIGGNTEGFIELMEESLNNYLVNESRKNISTYYIGHTSEKKLYEDSILKNNDIYTKFIDTLPQGVAHMVVRKNEVAFFSFLNPPLLYVIKSEKVAENYKQFFLMLWNMCDKT